MNKKGLNMEQKRNLIGWAFLLPAYDPDFYISAFTPWYRR